MFSMSSRHLKIFAAVYEKRNMTIAAESMYISQPSVSQAIKELEEGYGARLFERYPKKLYPTPQGELLYRYARQIIGLYEEAEREVANMSGSGSITIGANISAGTVLIREYIDSFHEVYPDVKVGVKVMGSGRLTEMIYDHSIEFAVMEDLVHDTTLIQEPFYDDRIVIIASPDNPLSKRKKLEMGDLMKCDFLLRDKGTGVRDKFDYIAKLRGYSVEPLWESTNSRALINAVKADYGIAVLPYLLVMEESENGEVAILDVEEDFLNRRLNLVYHKDKLFNERALELMKIIRESGKNVKKNN